MSLPIVLIIDDPAPLINVYWWHAAESQATENPTLVSGEAIVRDVPVDFLRHFVDVIDRHGIKGKFSVLPYPAGLGAITDGWPGCDQGDLNTWLDLVRQRVTPSMDISPEILTHAKTLDLDNLTLLSENEREWSRHQTAATMTPYIAYALKILNAADLEANGVTSPWDFGIDVEDEYRMAIRDAMREVNGRTKTWYFLHTQNKETTFRSRVVHNAGDSWQVSLCSQVGDQLWTTMDSRETGVDFINSVADAYLSEDGSSGRLAELYRAGTPIIWCTHWQSLFSNGRMTGLRALDEISRRIDALWGTTVTWMKCSELAAIIASNDTGEQIS
ncbi:MAG TPA: hypothetical protein DIC52_15795 [Candidatus Latescibacteria bacterium]|jgi:hypothetical protein|nr:hypothetical protein [Candidatus Latescibacterota bacterium]